jgi:Protease inhibitor Inh
MRGNAKAAVCAVSIGAVSCLASLVGTERAAAQWTGRADIAGRWRLHMPSGAYCIMGFSGAPETAHGTVAAMGFCPPLFLTHPRWLRDGDRVVITNRRGDALADLAVVGKGYLKGQIATGQPVMLVR